MVEYPADWKVMKLGQVAPLQRGFDLPTKDLEEGPYPVVYSNGICNYHSHAKCTGPGLVTGRSGTIGKFTYIDEGGYWPHNTALWVTSFNGNDPLFIKYLYETVGFDKYASGSGVPTLNRNEVHQHDLCIPPLPEQRRIAAVLSNADKLIANVEKRIAKKRAIKQGAMQELLTGKKRLPGFSGEWKKKILGISATVKARIGWQGLTTAEYFKDGDHYLVNGVNIENGRVNWQTCFMVDEKRYAQDKNIQLQNSDVLVSKDGTIGKVAYVENMPRTATLNSGVFVVRSIDAELSQEYLARVFLSMWFDDFIEKITAGSTIVHLYQKDIVQFAFQVPPTLAEQRAIAKVLSGMDAEIANLERKLEKLKLMKQGMMQDLLTGKVRLK